MTSQSKVGLMVLVALVILGAMILTVKDFHFFKSGYELKVIFNFVEGTGIGAPVMVAGVKVGKVREINFITEETNKVELTLWLEPRAKVKEDSKVYINTLGLMGEKYIEIAPGSVNSPALKAGSTIIGEDPVPVGEMMKEAREFAREAHNLLTSLSELVDTNKDDLRMAITNFKEVSLRLKKLTSSLSEIVIPHQEDFKEIIGSSRKVLQDLEKLTQSLERISQKIEKGEGAIGGLIHDEELYVKIKDIVKNFDELAKDVKKHPWKLFRKTRTRK
jgi:phospholipid/cholesterol/gamma-HCH transport system substrate-binding protein